MTMATQLEDRHDEEPLDQDDAPIEQDNGADGDEQGDEQGNPPAEDEQDEIGWGGTTVAGEDEPEGVRNLRQRLREREAELKALRAAPAVDDVGKEPDPDDYWEDPEGFKTALREYDERNRAATERANKQREMRERQAARWNDQERSFVDGLSALRVPDRESALEFIRDNFPGEQFAYLVKAGGENAPALAIRLKRDEVKFKQMRALADEGSWAEFIREATLASVETTVQRRKPTTTPEQQHRGTSGGGAHNSDAKLARLEAAAAKPGADRTELIAYKRQLRDRQRG